MNLTNVCLVAHAFINDKLALQFKPRANYFLNQKYKLHNWIFRTTVDSPSFYFSSIFNAQFAYFTPLSQTNWKEITLILELPSR